MKTGGKMLIFNYKRGIFSIREDVGTGNVMIKNSKTDIVLHFELLFSPIMSPDITKGNFSFRLLIPNYLINLEEEESVIFSRIHSNTRYKINRAMKRDELHYYEKTCPTDLDIEQFSLFYNPFAKERNIRLCDKNKLIALRDQQALILSYITDKDGQLLCYHVYQKDDTQGYLIYSASRRNDNTDTSYRNLIGRANRYLHWRDIQSFKKKGCKWYNFGGKVLNKDDIGGQNVNNFKLEFGPSNGYDSRSFYSKSLKGKIGLFFLHLKWRKKHEYKFTKNLYSKNLVSNYKSHET